MVLPVTNSQQDSFTLGYSMSHRNLSKQAKPWDRSLAYMTIRQSTAVAYGRELVNNLGNANFCVAIAYGASINGSINNLPNYGIYPLYAPAWMGPLLATVENKVYSKFRDAAFNTAQIGTTLAERRQSIDMIVKRSKQLLTFCNALRRFQFGDAARALGIAYSESDYSFRNTETKRVGAKLGTARSGRHYFVQGRRVKLLRPGKPGWRGHSHAFANNFLEFHFGWEPLVKDIYEGCKVFTEPIKASRIRVSAKGSHTSSNSALDPAGVKYWRQDWVLSYNVRITAVGYVGISNPDIFLANSLGLLNPAAIAWELVPFSFVVDWFGNIGQVLNSFSDWLGVTSLPNRSSTTITDSSKLTSSQTWLLPLGARLPGVEIYTERYGASSSRELRLPQVKLVFALPQRLSVARGATAISLLIQQGLRRKPVA